MKKIFSTVKGVVASVGVFAIPLLASAATIETILVTVKRLMDLGIPILITLALLYFLFGLGEYVLESHDDAKKTEGRNRMIYGVVALFVMVSVWGLVGVIASQFGITAGGQIPIPSIQERP